MIALTPNEIAYKILALFGENPNKRLHWPDIETLVDPERAAGAQLVETFNALIMPFGNISGSNHYFWAGLPEQRPEQVADLSGTKKPKLSPPTQSKAAS